MPTGRHLGIALLAAALLAGCSGGGAGGSQEAFCDEASDELAVFFPPGEREVDPALVGTLRDLAPDAPDELRPVIDEATSAGGDDALDESLRTIQEYLVEDCDLDAP